MAKEKVRKTAGGGKKKLSPYNTFMKQELPRVKADNPGLTHKDAFKKVAEIWKTSAQNPKNKPT